MIAGWAVPTILEHGTDEQRERFVRPSLLGDLVWCQLFSEPGAGSDLASLRTRAEKVDGGWRLTGQKVWNSVAERADWGICLARTNPDAPQAQGHQLLPGRHEEPGHRRPAAARDHRRSAVQRGVPRRRVRPRRLPGRRVDDGWKLARTTLANERVAMASSPARQEHRARRRAGRVGGLTAAQRVRSAAHRPLDGLLAARRALHVALARRRVPGAESSVAKLLGVRNRQDGAELVVALHGDAVCSAPPTSVRADVWEMLNTRCLSIAGGTTQVLRNVAGERILGLPRQEHAAPL